MLTKKEKEEIIILKTTKEYKAGVKDSTKNRVVDKEKKALYQARYMYNRGKKVLAEQKAAMEGYCECTKSQAQHA